MAAYKDDYEMLSSSSSLSIYSTDTTSNSGMRPSLMRRETEQILDYYQSADADTGMPYISQSPIKSTPDTVSPSRRTPSPELVPQDYTRVRRRSSVKTTGGSDNRRVAIVELDASGASSPSTSPSEDHASLTQGTETGTDSTSSSAYPRSEASGLLSRRGHEHSRLALVAPPDASPSSYANLSPPIPQSAPPSRTWLSSGASASGSQYGGDIEDELVSKYHRRSKSSQAEQQQGNKRAFRGTKGSVSSPRDVGIVGTTPFSGLSNVVSASTTFAPLSKPQYSSGNLGPTGNSRPQREVDATTPPSSDPQYRTGPPSSNSGLRAPLFQTPQMNSPAASPAHSRAPSPAKLDQLPPLPSRGAPTTNSGSSSVLITPAIGEEKDPFTKVAGPVMVDVMLDNMGRAVGTGNDDTAKARKHQMPSPSVMEEIRAALNIGPAAPRPPALTVSAPPPRPPRLNSPATLALNRRKDGVTATMQPLKISSAPSAGPSTAPITTGMPTADSDYSLFAVSVSSSGEIAPKSGKAPSPPLLESIAEATNHRREGAFPPSSDGETLNSERQSLSDRGGGRITDSPSKLRLELPRPILTSRWSSDGTTSMNPKSPTTSESGPLEKLVLEAGQTMDSLGLIKSGDLPPAPLVEPLRETKNAPFRHANVHNTTSANSSPNPVSAANLASKSPAKENFEDIKPSRHSRQSSMPAVDPRTSPDIPFGEHMEKSSSRGTPSPKPGSTTSKHQRRRSAMERVSRRISGERASASPESTKTGGSSASPKLPALQVRNITPPESVPPLPTPTSFSMPVNKVRQYAGLNRAASSKSSVRMSMVQQRAAPSSVPPTPYYTGFHDTTITGIKSLPKKKKRDPYGWPESMGFQDIWKKKSPLDRAAMYVAKMNELADEDSGLGDWIEFAKKRGPPQNNRENISPYVPPGTIRSSPHIRVPSNSSQMTASTFPMRSDSYAATEINPRIPADSASFTLPVNLPYPGLLQNSNARQLAPNRSFGVTPASSMRSLTAPAPPQPANTNNTGSSSGKSGGGFFASIGRRASMRRERPTLNTAPPTSSNKALSKVTSRANLTSSNSIVGGPRPNLSSAAARANIANCVIVIGRASSDYSHSPRSGHLPLDTESIADSTDGGAETDVSQVPNYVPQSFNPTRGGGFSSVPPTPGAPSTLPRSSLSYRSTTVGRTNASTVFNMNLDKLVDVLPHVERSVLAAYLKRAGGEDIRAIGAYLEDEKNGCVQRV